MKNRKGFTIVELVIVIAVIAILAAVLIPTFSGVVQRANESAALQKATSAMKTVLAQSDNATIANGSYFLIGKDKVDYAFKYDLNKISSDNTAGKVNDYTTLSVSGSEPAQVLNTIIVPVTSSEVTSTPSEKVLDLIKVVTKSDDPVEYKEISTLSDAEKALIPAASVKAIKVGTQVWGVLLNVDFGSDVICLTYSK